MTEEERFLYFSLTETESEISAKFRSLSSKLDFILQLGNFKARHLFFNFELRDVSADVEFIRKLHFPREKIKIEKLPKAAVNTTAKHRRAILALCNYQVCNLSQRKMLTATAQNLAKISSKPIYIFRELFSFLKTERIVLPGYGFLQDTVSKALNQEHLPLRNLLKNNLTTTEADNLDGLLTDSTNFYEITNLKREPKDFSFKEVKLEIERSRKIEAIKQISPTARQHINFMGRYEFGKPRAAINVR